MLIVAVSVFLFMSAGRAKLPEPLSLRVFTPVPSAVLPAPPIRLPAPVESASVQTAAVGQAAEAISGATPANTIAQAAQVFETQASAPRVTATTLAVVPANINSPQTAAPASPHTDSGSETPEINNPEPPAAPLSKPQKTGGGDVGGGNGHGNSQKCEKPGKGSGNGSGKDKSQGNGKGKSKR